MKTPPKNPPSKSAASKPQAERPTPADVDRRGFLVKASAAVIGTLIVLVPLATGIVAFFNPLRRKPGVSESNFLRVAYLDEIPADGTPRRFEVIADLWDQWTFNAQQPIGSVFIACGLEPSPGLQCFNTTCPHAGCSVRLASSGDEKEFKCPCHNSAFHLDGTVIQPTPSPRGLDALETEIRPGQDGRDEVWVRFENFYTGKAEKVAKV